MLENPATLNDVVTRWHPYPYAFDDAAADAMVQSRLDQAWRALNDELADLEAHMGAGSVRVESVVDVVVDATLRVLRNPDQHAEGSVALDDFRQSWKTDPTSRSSDMYFTAAELRRLSPTTHSGAFTIRPGGSPWTCRSF